MAGASPSPEKVVTRKLKPEDAPAVQQFHQRNGLSSADPESWKSLWATHPYREQFSQVPWGWGLFTEHNEMVGVFENIHIPLELEGRFLLGVAGSSWAVDPRWRSESFFFGCEFFYQTGVDLILDGSATQTVTKLMSAYEMTRIPTPDFNVNLLWVCQYQKFTHAVFVKKRLPATGLLTYPVAGAFRLANAVRSRLPKIQGKIIRLQSFDERFDHFWSQLRNGPPKVRAIRTAAMLRWRFSGERFPILVLERAGKMVGYIVLARRTRSHLGNLTQYSIVDWQLLEQNPQDAADLLVAAIHATKNDQIDLLNLSGFDAWKRSQAERLKPLKQAISFWNAHFKSPQPDFQKRLAAADLWDFTPFEIF